MTGEPRNSKGIIGAQDPTRAAGGTIVSVGPWLLEHGEKKKWLGFKGCESDVCGYKGGNRHENRISKSRLIN